MPLSVILIRYVHVDFANLGGPFKDFDGPLGQAEYDKFLFFFTSIACQPVTVCLSGIARGKLVEGIPQAFGKRRLYLYEI